MHRPDIASLDPLTRAFIDAGGEAGHPLTDDKNGLQQEGFGVFDSTIRKGALRVHTLHSYLITATAHLVAQPRLDSDRLASHCPWPCHANHGVDFLYNPRHCLAVPCLGATHLPNQPQFEKRRTQERDGPRHAPT